MRVVTVVREVGKIVIEMRVTAELVSGNQIRMKATADSREMVKAQPTFVWTHAIGMEGTAGLRSGMADSEMKVTVVSVARLTTEPI